VVVSLLRKMKRTLKHTSIVASLVLLLVVPTGLVVRNEQQEKKNQALIVAIKRNDANKVTALLNQGADPNTRYTPMTFEEIDVAYSQGTWPLRPNRAKTHLSLWQHIKRLFQPKSPPETTSIPALSVALDAYLDCLIDGKLPPKDSKLIISLIEAGADVNARGRRYDTPLMPALDENRRDIATLLIKRHSDIFAKDDYSNTTLILAAGIGSAELVNYLLSHGIDVNAKNKNGFTALMSAFYGRNIPDYETVEMLLDHGADISARDKEGHTALTMANRWLDPSVPVARRSGAAKVIALLEQAEKEQRAKIRAKR